MVMSHCWRIEMEKVAVLPVPDWALGGLGGGRRQREREGKEE